ncbi:MAG: energy-coupling factor ABC transporter ATP-binding protein [Bryobacteraceae bacterium]
MQPLVEIRDLFFEYDDGTRALDGVNFELYSGECVVLLGTNGSGKTTFLLHLNGLLTGKRPIRVCGLEVNRKNAAELRRRVGVVFQDSDDQLFMPTVIEDVAFGPLNEGLSLKSAWEKAAARLEEVGVLHVKDKAPYHLSSGEKRRVALAGILAMTPEILVLDEPTTSLDPPAQRELVEILRRLPQAKVIATHDVHFARAIGTRAVFFERGSIIASGPVSEIVSRFRWDVSEEGS